MHQPRLWSEDGHARTDADRQTAGLAGIAFILFLLVVGLFLVHTLYQKSKIEDCLMAGRIDCDRLLTKH